MPRVLVVDDFPDARDLLSGFLASRGFETEEAVDGQDAVERALDHPPDVILMDIAMPRMDGVTATERLKADPRTAHVPVIAVTGQAHHPTSVSPPCDAVLVKPVDPVRVEREIRRVLGEASSRADVLGAARAAIGPARRRAARERAEKSAARPLVWLLGPPGRVRDAIALLLERERFEALAFDRLEQAERDPRAIEVAAAVVDLELADAIDVALTLRSLEDLEDLVVVGLEPEEEGAPDEVRPLFDALVARSDEVVKLPGLLRRALARSGARSEPDEVSVSVGDPVFSDDVGEPFGTVLEVRREFLMVDVAGAGAFVVPASAVASVVDGRIVVDVESVDDDLREAIAARR